ncbi:hypothetical protein OG21DRAFT_905409 [Imleria badia]|nr:hypothetical protein OG21DRAFT_905409 [Imleria badia]
MLHLANFSNGTTLTKASLYLKRATGSVYYDPCMPIMLYDDPSASGVSPPPPSPESAVQPPPSPIPTPDHLDRPSWARRPQTPINYPYYPFTPYNTTPFVPPTPSVHGTPTSQPRPESPGSHYPMPSALPFSPGMPHTGYPTSLQGTPWAPPQPIPPPNAMLPPPWAVQHTATGYNAFNQPLPGMWPPLALPPMGPFTPAETWPMPPGMSPYPAYTGYTPWQHPTLQPPPSTIHGNPGYTALAGSPWKHNTDRMDPFAEGPHYGPVLEPFLAKIVGAVIKLNPLLAPPHDTQDDYLRWNMLFRTSNCYRTTEPQRSWARGRNTPATHPRMTHVQIISSAFPWMIQARAHDPKLGLTCGEVLDAISIYMYGDVAKMEYGNLPSKRERQIWENYQFNRSTDSNAPGGRLGEGLKRLDWLGSSSRFGGLVANDTFVKEHCGDVLPCTFELKCLPTYPLTAEEVREQQQRLEMPAGGQVCHSVCVEDAGKSVIGAGLAHGITYGVEFTLYDAWKRSLVVVVVDKLAAIEDFQTTVTTTHTLTNASFAKLSRVGNLPLYLTPGSGSVLEGIIQQMDMNGFRVRLAKEVKEAKVEVAMENDLAVFKVLDQQLKRFGLTDLSFETTLDRLTHTLRAAGRYYWYLDLTNENKPIDTKDGVGVDLYLLQESESEYDDHGMPLLLPIEPGFRKTHPNAESLDFIDFVVDPDAVYGIKITNNTTRDLYLNAFLFNSSSLSIGGQLR